jgi:hypothetical protein
MPLPCYKGEYYKETLKVHAQSQRKTTNLEIKKKTIWISDMWVHFNFLLQLWNPFCGLLINGASCGRCARCSFGFLRSGGVRWFSLFASGFFYSFFFFPWALARCLVVLVSLAMKGYFHLYQKIHPMVSI